MAILIDDIEKVVPFKIEFVSYLNTARDIRYLKALETFTTSSNPVFIVDLGLKEYDNLAVRFSSDDISEKEIRLYMDCFDFIDEIEDDVTLGIENAGFITQNKEVFIHRHFDNDVGSPLIPGVYKIKVVSGESVYYSQILINPNNLEIDEHYQMIKEIESNVKGLARDWVRKNKSLEILKDCRDIDPTYLDYAYLILKNKDLLKYSMDIVKKNPYTSLIKNYSEIPFSKSGKLDSKSMKLNQLRHSAALYNRYVSSNEKIYSYKMDEDYANKVNQYLVKTIEDFLFILRKSLIDISDIKKFFKNEIDELNRYNRYKTLGRESRINNREQQLLNIIEFENNIIEFQNNLQHFKNTTFLKNVKQINNVRVSQQFIKTPGYNNFYRVALLVNGQLQNQIEDLYDYNWKSTEVLYEYWCMIKIVKCLKELEFTPVKGWFFDNSNEHKKVTIPAIPDGTSIVFQNDNYSLKLIFNEAIGKSPEVALRDGCPYWIRTERNKPDFRIDVYKDGVFQKTIILDAKYSSAERFWNKKHINTANKSKVVEQLKLYANNIYNIRNRRENVVEVVIALCPTYIKAYETFDNDENHSIGVATLKPGIENMIFKEKLEEFLYR
ncbi:nuclease domain-containing protein [Gracilibacillus salinarum]|uniref:DUF2357 domain-containing protein n=1 Tax=Gracilibacillus salinarum TaxID=2932255 RepID=A0ABY4GLY6_9BACI|nr:nuclease domain-containing protein [Gracilibacillus salinarum]UOQ85249.1 hypothetical protein MUN87_21840 [Gracilibacillus salinarum]